MLKTACGILILLIAGIQAHYLIHRAVANEWRSHDMQAALAVLQSAHRESGWNVDAWREYAHLASGTDMDAAITAIKAALVWEPADAYLWSRLAVFLLYSSPPQPDLALQAARSVSKLAPHTVPIHIEQSLLAARFYNEASPELRAIWDKSLIVAQFDRYGLARAAISAQLEISLCGLIDSDAPLSRWCSRAENRRVRCEGDPSRLSERQLRQCAAAGYRTQLLP